MKAITLWQPWATLIALGAKTIETRSWSTSHRGPIAIHAAQRVTGRRGDVTELGAYSIERDAAGLLLRGPIAHPYRLPLGEVVATANLVECVPMVERQPVMYERDLPQLWLGDPEDEDGTAHVVTPELFGFGSRCVDGELPYGHYEPGRWAWVLEDIEPIRRPIPATGRQGLWEWDAPSEVQPDQEGTS